MSYRANIVSTTPSRCIATFSRTGRPGGPPPGRTRPRARNSPLWVAAAARPVRVLRRTRPLGGGAPSPACTVAARVAGWPGPRKGAPHGVGLLDRTRVRGAARLDGRAGARGGVPARDARPRVGHAPVGHRPAPG